MYSIHPIDILNETTLFQLSFNFSLSRFQFQKNRNEAMDRNDAMNTNAIDKNRIYWKIFNE